MLLVALLLLAVCLFTVVGIMISMAIDYINGRDSKDHTETSRTFSSNINSVSTVKDDHGNLISKQGRFDGH